MSIHPLAPVHWQMGQTLLPDHLIAQETALTAEASLRHQSAGLPSYGIGKVEWDKYLLDGGTLDIKALRIYTRTNRSLIDFPGNANIVNVALNFPDQARAEVYYFVLQHKQVINTEQFTRAVNQTISQRLYLIILGVQPRLSEEYEKLLNEHQIIEQGKLAEFTRSEQKNWKLSERYVPPLVQIGVSDFLLAPLRQLTVLLGRFLKESLALYQTQQLPDIRLLEIKQCVNALYASQQFLANHIGHGREPAELKMHPYFLYEHLQKLFHQLSLLNGEWSPIPLQNYQHNDLHGTFKLLFRNIVARLKLHDRTSQSFQFHLKDGMYQALIPNGIGPNDNLYLVINCTQQGSLSEQALPCISSRRRIATLFHYSLSGVALKAVKHSALTHYFGETSQCFQLVPGEEFTHIIKDTSLAFLAQTEFENYSFYVFYQSQSALKQGMDHATVK